jgi:hypothetical protein
VARGAAEQVVEGVAREVRGHGDRVGDGPSDQACDNQEPRGDGGDGALRQDEREEEYVGVRLE